MLLDINQQVHFLATINQFRARASKIKKRLVVLFILSVECTVCLFIIFTVFLVNSKKKNMENKNFAGKFALVTGGASGIGKALCLTLAKKGACITIVDFNEKAGNDAVSLVEKEHANFNSQNPAAIFVKCDVSNPDELAAAFEKHLQTFGRLDVCINGAGIAEKVPFDDDNSQWKHIIAVNLSAVIESTRTAIRIMEAGGYGGTVLNIGSAAGLYPMQGMMVYSASKGGVVMFSRSLKHYKQRKGIRVNVLCPEFVETDLARKVPAKVRDTVGGFIPMEMVIKGCFELLEDDTKAGDCLWITNRHGLQYWPTPEEKKKYMVPYTGKKTSSSAIKTTDSLVFSIPKEFEKVVVHRLDSDFRKATHVERLQVQLSVKPGHVLVKNIYAGVNASDVNYSSGRYFNNEKKARSSLPFDAGFEAVGIIVAVGNSVHDLKINMPVATMSFGAYAEFSEILAAHCLPIPSVSPEVLAMLTSGLTASIGLEQGAMKSGQIVMVTAAAGGTGQFAVQLAKLAGNKVVATCGGSIKEQLLKDLGVDRVINYHKEDIKSVLKKEFPDGINIIYESVGGDMFMTCLNALAVYGRIVVIGMMSQYQADGGWKPASYTGLCEKLLFKSQAVVGFLLTQYANLWRKHLQKLCDLYAAGKLKVLLDPKQFMGVNSVADAVEYLHSGQSIGKVVVCMDPSFSRQAARL